MTCPVVRYEAVLHPQSVRFLKSFNVLYQPYRLQFHTSLKLRWDLKSFLELDAQRSTCQCSQRMSNQLESSSS